MRTGSETSRCFHKRINERAPVIRSPNVDRESPILEADIIGSGQVRKEGCCLFYDLHHGARRRRIVADAIVLDFLLVAVSVDVAGNGGGL